MFYKVRNSLESNWTQRTPMRTSCVQDSENICDFYVLPVVPNKLGKVMKYEAKKIMSIIFWEMLKIEWGEIDPKGKRRVKHSADFSLTPTYHWKISQRALFWTRSIWTMSKPRSVRPNRDSRSWNSAEERRRGTRWNTKKQEETQRNKKKHHYSSAHAEHPVIYTSSTLLWLFSSIVLGSH